MEMLPIPSIVVISVPEPPNPDSDGAEEEMDPCSVGVVANGEFPLNLL